jgi:hypothetical protein
MSSAPTKIIKGKTQQTTTTTAKQTIIPVSRTKEEYKKAGIKTVPYNMSDSQREVFERQTKGIWTRKVTAVFAVKGLDEQWYLDWHEERQGKSPMGRILPQPVQHVSKYVIPTPLETVEYDEESEENKLIQLDREASTETAYEVPFSKEALQELIDDAKPRQCEYGIILQGGVGGLNYSTNKDELMQYADKLDVLYEEKIRTNAPIRKEVGK